MAKDWIKYWMEREETPERAAYLAKGSEALASGEVFRVAEPDQEGCQCDVPESEKCAHTLTNRFGFEVYDADHKRILAVGGFSTHDDAEQAASRKREEIQRKGWRMQVYVTEHVRLLAL